MLKKLEEPPAKRIRVDVNKEKHKNKKSKI